MFEMIKFAKLHGEIDNDGVCVKVCVSRARARALVSLSVSKDTVSLPSPVMRIGCELT